MLYLKLYTSLTRTLRDFITVTKQCKKEFPIRTNLNKLGIQITSSLLANNSPSDDEDDDSEPVKNGRGFPGQSISDPHLQGNNRKCAASIHLNPCLYIMRFANKLQFGKQTHDVSMTALRIVQRMKKDSIHSGRRPTGLCGAALLIAARMHDFNRTITDLVQIVKIHESTLRKRLTEFADTPSSALTLDEFMAVDLEAEQDPPAFKVARKRDRERIQKLGEKELTELQKQIDAQLEKDLKKMNKTHSKVYSVEDQLDQESYEADEFIRESNMEAINEYLADDPEAVGSGKNGNRNIIKGLKPDIASMCMPPVCNQIPVEESINNKQLNDELILSDVDDDEIDGYIMTEQEAKYKNDMWMKLNAEFLQEMKLKEERLAKEREEGKPEKKKRKPRKKVIGPSNSATEAIEKMLQEKKISSKINYDILKSLTEPKTDSVPNDVIKFKEPDTTGSPLSYSKVGGKRYTPLVNLTANKKRKVQAALPVVIEEDALKPLTLTKDDIEEEEDAEPEPEPEPEAEYSSLKDMLDNGEDEDEYYGYDEEVY